MEIENLITSLDLSQIISEPTNFEASKNPSCIDLIITEQHNLNLDSGTRDSLNSSNHQIIYCKVNLRIPPPPPFERTIWQTQLQTQTQLPLKGAWPIFPGLNILKS